VEFYIWKGLFVAVDFTEALIWQVAYDRDIPVIVNAVEVQQNLKIAEGGFKPQYNVQALIGWHF